jgi:ketosteroid isomerase-like protein
VTGGVVTGAVDAALRSRRNVNTVRRFLHLLEKKDMDGWIALWAEDGAQFYPFGTEMFPRETRGRQAVYEIWRGAPDMFDSLRFTVRETWTDGDTVIAQFDGDCVMVDGTRYRNTYMGLFRFTADGAVAEYWEYFDPIVAFACFGMADVTYRRSA